MNATGQPLLAAVLASPEDDLPRLAFADWLDGVDGDHPEIDHDRAEFIRVQIALATKDADQHRGNPDEQDKPCPACVHYAALRRRERELLGDGRWLLWAHPVAPLVGRLDPGQDGDGLKDPLRANWALRRGFVESITCTSADWLSHADAILAAQPVREVRLTTWPEAYGEGAWPIGMRRVGRPDGAGRLVRYETPRWPRVTFTLPPHNVIPWGPGVSMPGPDRRRHRQIQELDRLVRRAMRRT